MRLLTLYAIRARVRCFSSPAESVADISLLDLRVGRIVECVRHPTCKSSCCGHFQICNFHSGEALRGKNRSRGERRATVRMLVYMRMDFLLIFFAAQFVLGSLLTSLSTT
jgi:hypothetical protein